MVAVVLVLVFVYVVVINALVVVDVTAFSRVLVVVVADLTFFVSERMSAKFSKNCSRKRR